MTALSTHPPATSRIDAARTTGTHDQRAATGLADFAGFVVAFSSPAVGW